MSLDADDFRDLLGADKDDDAEVPLGGALSELAVDVDSVAAVRGVRERS